MIPLFGEDDIRRRKEINLGGTRTASYPDILQEAKAQRSQRHVLKRKQDSATKIQAWWRGISRKQQTRRELRQVFAGDVAGLTGLRCLVLLGVDQEALGMWSSVVVSGRQDSLSTDILSHTEDSWRVLLRRTSVLLLRAIAATPESQNAPLHLNVLQLLLSSAVAAPEYTQYVLGHGFYSLLGEAIQRIPIESKASPTLPPLIDLVTTPLSEASLHAQTLPQVLTHILSIPLLLNRLPLPALTALSARLPLSALHLAAPSIPSIVADRALAEPEPKVHLIANLVVLTPPRYAKLPAKALEAYLELMAALMNALPTHALEPPERNTRDATRTWADADEDEDGDEEGPAPQAIVVTSFEPPPRLPELDKRTRTRLQTLPSSQHLNSLLGAAQHQSSRQALIAFCFALTTVWPKRRDKVLGTAVAFNGGGLVREIYRSYVRGAPLGREDTLSSLTNPEHAAAWPPLLFLVDLYTQALLTMGDDEFFNSSGPTVHRNPLTLDELTSFSRQMLNIAFTLYWRDDLRGGSASGDSVPGVASLKWEGVRDKLTRCLQAIHTRECVVYWCRREWMLTALCSSRRPFTPPDHWLVTSQVDMISFIQAAVYVRLLRLFPQLF
ncbi:hypothetical protein DAEQUDRAFT_679458 [Daedalea quercina L-15889]|uniref:HECT-type E3 ubiquitin transferase n=1 Tax=Daedalea quercina L-15889 TaxID=1314783 RepID=A0A165L5E5_9APHY|nr:hypothetical protein DAEQUDRAFT_679458 [Daedalea quercina L-15889]